MPPDTPGIVFRPASSPGAGGGHMGRCLALAQAMGKALPVTFALAPDSGKEWPERLRNEGFALYDPAYGAQAAAIPIVVLDDYDLTTTEIADWRRRANLLVMIEDNGKRFDDIDLYISPGRPATAKTDMLSGPEYALLAPEYAAPALPLAAGSAVRHLLVSFGLRDTRNATGLALEAVALLCRKNRPRQLTVILGGTAPHLETIAQQVSGLGGRLVTDAPGLRAFYNASDLVIGAGGVSLFERLACGRPSITIINAGNQVAQAKAVASRGGTVLAGSGNEVSARTLSALIGDLICDEDRRRAMALRGRSIVDGKGAYRAAETIKTFAQNRIDP